MAKDVKKKKPVVRNSAPSPEKPKIDEQEYNSLKAELLQLFKQQISSINLGLGGTILIAGINLSKDYQFPLVFLVPLIILSLCIIQLLQDYYSVLHIAVYIQVNLESSQKRWENWMAEVRKRFLDVNPIVSIYAPIYFVWISAIVGYLCIALAVIYEYPVSEKSLGRIGDWRLPIDFKCTTFYVFVAGALIFWAYISTTAIVKLGRRSLSKYEAENRQALIDWKNSNNAP